MFKDLECHLTYGYLQFQKSFKKRSDFRLPLTRTTSTIYITVDIGITIEAAMGMCPSKTGDCP